MRIFAQRQLHSNLVVVSGIDLQNAALVCTCRRLIQGPRSRASAIRHEYAVRPQRVFAAHAADPAHEFRTPPFVGHLFGLTVSANSPEPGDASESRSPAAQSESFPTLSETADRTTGARSRAASLAVSGAKHERSVWPERGAADGSTCFHPDQSSLHPKTLRGPAGEPDGAAACERHCRGKPAQQFQVRDASTETVGTILAPLDEQERAGGGFPGVLSILAMAHA